MKIYISLSELATANNMQCFPHKVTSVTEIVNAVLEPVTDDSPHAASLNESGNTVNSGGYGNFAELKAANEQVINELCAT